MILGITNLGNGELAVIGLGILGLFLFGHAGRRLIDLWIDHMRRHNQRPQLLDEYADFNHDPADDTEALADSLRSTGRHADVPPATAVETTQYLPRINQLPVDDEAALRVVQSLGGGER